MIVWGYMVCKWVRTDFAEGENKGEVGKRYRAELTLECMSQPPDLCWRKPALEMLSLHRELPKYSSPLHSSWFSILQHRMFWNRELLRQLMKWVWGRVSCKKAREKEKAQRSSGQCTACSDACLPRNCRWFKDVCVSSEKKSKEPFNRAATILREKHRHMSRGPSPLSQGEEPWDQTPSEAEHKPCRLPLWRGTPDCKEEGSKIVLSSDHRINWQVAVPLE